ncbi:MAG: hypothetical protein HY271_19860 [Deltaproteobacteria bacterium]|nr:hypothetical protein [Deltaproteobacteria bacterium]
MEVLPPSASGETRLVLQAIAAIVFGSFFVIGFHASDGGLDGGPRAGDLAPFQIFFRDATPTVQRTMRELQEGVTEAENARSASKRWPTVETLAAQGIPPFTNASDRWRLVQSGLYVTYVGTSAVGPDAPAFLALIQEPELGYVETVMPAAPSDELHHRLSDGTLLHVSFWFHRESVVADDQVIARPFATGWTQVLVGRQRP